MHKFEKANKLKWLTQYSGLWFFIRITGCYEKMYTLIDLSESKSSLYPWTDLAFNTPMPQEGIFV